MSDILDAQTIERLAGYKRPAEQLRELKAQGFYRARLAKVTGEVVLERPHYDEVARGRVSGVDAANQPKLRQPKCSPRRA